MVTYTFDPILVKLRQGDYHDYIMSFSQLGYRKRCSLKRSG